MQDACTLAHLLGLFRLDPGESLLSLGYRGALADILLWGFTRIQTHMFASNTYDRSAQLSVICLGLWWLLPQGGILGGRQAGLAARQAGSQAARQAKHWKQGTAQLVCSLYLQLVFAACIGSL